MKKLLLIFCFIFGLSGFCLAQAATTPNKPHPVMQKNCSVSAIKFNKAMRALWEDHIIYTHLYIISALSDQPNADLLAKRLLRNQDDIGNAVKPYYGDAAGAKLTSLLRDHIMIAAEVVNAAKMDKAADLQAANKKWQDNAVVIAEFLSGANPNWSKEKLQKMLLMHLDITTANVVARLQKDWKKDIDTFDEGEAFMLNFADVLSDGIIKQFPNKFKS